MHPYTHMFNKQDIKGLPFWVIHLMLCQHILATGYTLGNFPSL